MCLAWAETAHTNIQLATTIEPATRTSRLMSIKQATAIKGVLFIGSMLFSSPDWALFASFSAFLLWRRPPVSVAPRNLPPGVRRAARRPGTWQSRCGFQVSIPGEHQSTRRSGDCRAVPAMTMINLSNECHLAIVTQATSRETPSIKTQPPHADDRQEQARSLHTLISDRWPLEKLFSTARYHAISDHMHG